MNKRKKKKKIKKEFDEKLYNAIVELNRMVAEDIGEEFTEDGLIETYEYVSSNPRYIRQTFRDYEKYILNKEVS